jgi:hypothetical protein
LRTPSSPYITSRTSAGVPTIVNTTSLAAATAPGESSHAAPAVMRSSALLRVRVVTVAR